MSAVCGGGGVLEATARVMFLYWGRRGLTRFVIELAHAAVASTRIDASVSVSRQNEGFTDFGELGSRLVPVDTFATNAGVLGQSWRIPLLRGLLAREVTDRRVEAVIELMPHVWSSFVLPVVKEIGVRYATIVHDAETHPGDYRSFSIARLVKRSTAQADVVITLSEAVAARLVATGQVPRKRVFTLFHPDLDFGRSRTRSFPRDGEPFRLAFLGRILPYKGLPLFLEALQLLRDEGIPVSAGVFGEGDLGDSTERLEAMGAEVVNRWLTEAEIGDVLKRYHAIVLSHIEASQSGVAATALGAGIPVVATPVGGLIEQVQDGVTGVLATRVDAYALKQAAMRLILNPQLYRVICGNIVATKEDRSMARFVEDCVRQALGRHVSQT